MRIVKQSVKREFITPNALKLIELIARTCYKSEGKIAEGTDEQLVKKLIDNGHHAMLEHASASYRIICDRGVSHEIVRHRLFSFAQESTRYVNYKEGIEVICPSNIPEGEYNINSNTRDLTDTGIKWISSVLITENAYKDLIAYKVSPQIARSVLPTCLKTELVVTGNFREWLHFLRLRTSPKAHPQIQEIAKMIQNDLSSVYPLIFKEI